jgi:aspartyl-tRNA(Asn)/glutamyl-tRNA(Gln) amidotransferase subunit B
VTELVASGALNDRLARQVLAAVLAGEGGPDEVIAFRGLAVVSDEGKLAAVVDEAIEANPEVAGREWPLRTRDFDNRLSLAEAIP